MRVIAGEAKGRTLRVPRGLGMRPSGSRLREALFGILEHRGAVYGARVLDVFAGGGGLGIEALSRGAASLVAVERDPEVALALRANLEACGFADRARVLVQTAATSRGVLRKAGPFDLALLDPPYRSRSAEEVLAMLVAEGLLAARALVAVETSHGESVALPEGLEHLDTRRYGDSQIMLLGVSIPPGALEKENDVDA